MNIITVNSPNFSSGRNGFYPEAVVVHIMEGTLTGTDAWFTNPRAGASAHYGVGLHGEIHRYVRETDTAWHAGRVHAPSWSLIQSAGRGAYINPNFYTIGIEHEGNDQSDWPDAMYGATCELISDICARWSIPIDRAHIIGHREIYSLKTCPGSKADLKKIVELSRKKAGITEPPDFQYVRGTAVFTVNCNLRGNNPSTKAPVVRIAKQGSELPFTGFSESGEAVNGNPRWYKTTDNLWFWGGTAREKTPAGP